ncbi:glycosyl transferase [Arthrobacter sp. MYb227]|uniref:glycosyltransferase n=1 Tax=Arthrobacter sp. MYb227 TaxID=1848601 RepID=UPI000CFD8DFC|nr:glycosyltransferase [Arthrobacter sp. MYb227]PQZ87725.1 glycosyl transferase [Arthrobacter sp. MYb227]
MSGLIVHEWLEPTGGAEKVVQEMASTYPDARILTLWNDGHAEIDDSRVSETWLAKTPFRSNKAIAIPAMLPTWRRQSLGDADWALVSSHLFAHHVSFTDAKRDVEKFVYVHTPARYIWEPDLDARGNSMIARGLAGLLKPVDRRRAAEGANFAANSEFVRDRIRRTWNQDAEVIYPPVSVKAIQSVECWADELGPDDAEILARLPEKFVLSASRFVPYKRLDMAITVAEASGIPAVIAGSGPDETRLRARAAESSVPVHFVQRPSDPFLYALYERAVAYVFMAIEDFGIMPVEAMAIGTPVICGNEGGVLETVSHGMSGAHLQATDVQALREALELTVSLDRAKIRSHATKFDASLFRRNIESWTGRSSTNEQISGIDDYAQR